MKRKNPETSVTAFRSLKIEEVNETYREILVALGELGKGTMEDISAHMKCSRDRVWKRLSELCKMELIYRPGTKKMLKSGKMGYEWMRTNGEPKTDIQHNIEKFPSGKSSSDYANEIIKSATKIPVQKNLFE